MAEGHCLCGTIRWRVDGPMTPLSHCHCSKCRKAHGAAFATFTSCDVEAFTWLAGEEARQDYASSPDLVRRFCRHCGSSVPGEVRSRRRMVVPAGGFEDDPGLRGGRHLFAASKAPWSEIADDLERHDAYPTNSAQHAGLPTYDAHDPGPAEPGRLRGSCLCGGVAFALTEPFRIVHNCHCSRCRQARAAAHATNGFVSATAVEILHGEDLIETFRLPGAQFFAQSFCRCCGSALPRRDPTRGIANVPLSSLDDDPGRGADDHIFTASKAPWWEIADTLPRFEEAPT